MGAPSAVCIRVRVIVQVGLRIVCRHWSSSTGRPRLQVCLPAPYVPVMSAHNVRKPLGRCPELPAPVVSAARDMSCTTRIITTKGLVADAADINFYCRNQRLRPRHIRKFKMIMSRCATASAALSRQLRQIFGIFRDFTRVAEVLPRGHDPGNAADSPAASRLPLSIFKLIVGRPMGYIRI